MLKKSLIIVSLSALIFLAACTKPNPANTDQDTILPQEQIQTIQDQVVENSNTRNTCGELTDQKWFWPDSYLVWDVKKVWWFHTGTVPLEWFMSVCNWNFVATQIIFNFDNLTVSDVADPSMNQRLSDHLRSEDFFSTDNFPTWIFVSKLLTKNPDWYNVVWDLTIKWITNEISFPIQVIQQWDEYKISWKIDLDRTIRDIMYQSTKLVDTLKDKAIEDTIKTSFELATSPAL